MRTLKAAVIIMGVMIVGGVVTLGVLIAQRTFGAGAAGVSEALLDEAEGTRIVGASLQGDRVALTLQGGGADRVVVVDLRTGKPVGRIALKR